MTYGREKRRLLGWLALLAPIPLPLNDVLEWPVLFVYAFFVIHFLQRVEKGQREWLPNWALNLLGLIYIPIMVVDVRLAMMREQAVEAILHLILFVVLAKLYSIRREKDKWHIFISLFFLFVAAMATSSHLTIFFYLLGALAAGFYVMMRFAHLHVLARLGRAQRPIAAAEDRSDEDRAAGDRGAAPSLPSIRWAGVVALLLVVLLAVPIFASLPRLRQPFIMGQGSGNIGLSRTTGFSDSVDLSLTTEIRSNSAIALRLETDAQLDAENLRFKATTYDFYRNRNWYRHRLESRQIFTDAEGLMWLPGAGQPGAGRPGAGRENLRAKVFLEPLRSFSLIVPMRTVAIDVLGQASSLRLDAGGAVVLPQQPRQTVSYDVILGERVLIAGELDDHPQLRLDALDTEGLSPRIIELAAQVMGEGSEEERIDRLLRHLLNEYEYTLDFTGRQGERPLEEFLFQFRSGHCELFASSMVLMLRSQGIPARFVTGFLGAEVNALEGTYVVRQRNAHAWVEAFSPGRGWQVYDPTPPNGRPAAAVRDWRLLLQQLYDYVAFRWDRYVLTYGADDQSSFFAQLRQRLEGWWQSLWDAEEERVLPAPAEAPGAELGVLDQMEEPAEAPWQRPWVRALGLLAFVSLVVGLVIFLRRRQQEPAEAYDALRSGLADLGLDVDLSTPPLALRRAVAERYPAASAPAGAVIDLYVSAAFAELPATAEQRRALRAQLGAALAAVAAAEKAKKKALKRSGGRATGAGRRVA